jgi:hypothetical protein
MTMTNDTGEHRAIVIPLPSVHPAGSGLAGPPTEPVRFDCGVAPSHLADYGWPSGTPDSGWIDWDADTTWSAVVELRPDLP